MNFKKWLIVMIITPETAKIHFNSKSKFQAAKIWNDILNTIKMAK